MHAASWHACGADRFNVSLSILPPRAPWVMHLARFPPSTHPPALPQHAAWGRPQPTGQLGVFLGVSCSR